uniref:Uncharacterized protein n=1 Tax=Arundo donax TaxID=35708 RepID=A0A0A9CC72_ARUDO
MPISSELRSYMTSVSPQTSDHEIKVIEGKNKVTIIRRITL